MRKKYLVLLVMASFLVMGTPNAWAQEDSRTEIENLPGWTQTLYRLLSSIEKRTVAIAEDFPEELYNTYRPTGDEDTRTVAEILLHIALTNASVAFETGAEEQKQAYVTAHGGVPNVRNFVFTSKADTVAKVKATFAAVRQVILTNPDPGNAGDVVGWDNAVAWWMYALAHSSEHFGNLITYYRVNGLVPPTSRQ